MDPELASMMRVKPAPLTLQQEVQLGSSITVISPSPDGTAVAVGTVDEQVIVYDAQLQHTASCSGHEGGTNGLAWLPGNRLASVGEDGSLRVWAADSGQQLAEVACEGVDVDK
jgi:WD40 repeat protein